MPECLSLIFPHSSPLEWLWWRNRAICSLMTPTHFQNGKHSVHFLGLFISS
uniref:Uncharacterized protein n=1 Tax=Anguilla anguilla TaxID=7936 RepID=A0A0E9W6U8_ANGAN